jgi:hypothetical protein
VVCHALRTQGIPFITEAESSWTTADGKKKSARFDVVNLREGSIVEIIFSESKESIAAKRNDYPLPTDFLRVSFDGAGVKVEKV